MQLQGHQATEKAKQAPSRKDKDHRKRKLNNTCQEITGEGQNNKSPKH
jgi:hypothetical protein